MPTVNLTEIARIALKLFYFALLFAVLATFIKLLMDKIPPINLTGCTGYFVNEFGLILGINIMVSIVLWGFTVKFAFSFFSRYLD